MKSFESIVPGGTNTVCKAISQWLNENLYAFICFGAVAAGVRLWNGAFQAPRARVLHLEMGPLAPPTPTHTYLAGETP